MIGGKLVNATAFTCEHVETEAHCTGKVHPYGKLNRHYLHPSKQSSPKSETPPTSLIDLMIIV